MMVSLEDAGGSKSRPCPCKALAEDYSQLTCEGVSKFLPEIGIVLSHEKSNKIIYKISICINYT